MKKVLFILMIAMLLLAMAIPAFAAPAPKIGVCHLTSSESNPWVLIHIRDKALGAHLGHGDQVVGVDVDENCEPLIVDSDGDGVPDDQGQLRRCGQPGAGRQLWVERGRRL